MLRRLIEFALTQRIFILAMSGLVAAGGFYAFRTIPIDAFPNISPIQVKMILKAPGMTPEEVSAIYARFAQGGGGRMGGGIGLELIARLCEHLGWTLEIRSDPDRGTVTRLALSSSP